MGRSPPRRCLRPPCGPRLSTRPPLIYRRGRGTAFGYRTGFRFRRQRRWPRQARVGSGKFLVEPQLDGLLVDIQGEGELGHENLRGPWEHSLLTSRQAHVLVTDRQVPDDLGNLVDVAGSELFRVVLLTTGPVGRHPGVLFA